MTKPMAYPMGNERTLSRHGFRKPWTVCPIRRSPARTAAIAGFPLAALAPSATYPRRVTAPAGLPTGTYPASLAVVDPTGYLAPAALANTSRLADGCYRLGLVGAARTGPTTSRRR